jgi:hypothetical protein
MRTGSVVVALLAALPGLAPAQGLERYHCTFEDGHVMSILLASRSRFDVDVHCVEEERLRTVVAGCAPDGGWGLSAGDGSQDLIDVATDPQGLSHDGGWFFARLGPSEFVASASVGSRPPLALEVAGETFWRLRLTLATGEGTVETREGEEPVVCEAGGGP